MPAPTTNDAAVVITVPSRPSSTTADAATGNNNSSGEKTRFVGKHSKDHLLSLYVQHRNIAEFAGTEESAVQPLQMIVRINPELTLKSGERVYIGVLGRLVCDYGLQLAEHIIFQSHLPVYPSLASSSTPNTDGHPSKKKTFAESIFSLDQQFVGLPDDRHIAVQVKLPPGMPPSTVLLATGNPFESWGLAYYVCAFVSGHPAPSEGNSTTTWDRLRAAQSGKVVLSFSRTLLHSNPSPTAIPPTVSNKRSSLTSSKAVTLKASLDRSAYRHSDPMTFSITLTNPKRASIVGLRITLKQIVTVRFAGEGMQRIKSCYGRFDFRSVFTNNEQAGRSVFDEPDTAALRSRRSSYPKGVSIESLCRDACSFADSFTIIPRLAVTPRPPYQLALQSVLPRDPAPTSRCIATSCRFDGLVASIGGGLDQLRYFAVEYYANVHAVFRWSRNLIVKLPFTIYSDRLATVEGALPPSIIRQPSAGNLHAESSRLRHGTVRKKTYDLIDLDDTDDDYLINQTTTPFAAKRDNTTTAATALARNVSVSSLASTMARSTISSSPRHLNHNEDDSNSDEDDLLTTAMSFKEDVQVAIQSLSGSLRAQLSSAQQSMLRQQCTESERNEQACKALQMELSACMHDLIDILLPKLLLRASASKDGPATKKSNTAMRIVNVVVDRLAPLHTRLIGKQEMMGREEKEAEIEQLNKWLDTLEVLFTRIATPAANNNVGEVVTSLQQQALRLLLSNGDASRHALELMAAFCEVAAELHAIEDASLLFELVDAASCSDDIGDVWAGDLLARAFQCLADSLVSMEVEAEEGLDRDDLLVNYLEQLCRHFCFFLNPSFTATDSLREAIQQAAFWHFHFASLALSRASALSAIGQMVKGSVLDQLKWSRSAMQGVPSYCSFITSPSNPPSQKTVDEEEVQRHIMLCGSLVIESMRHLGDLLSSSPPITTTTKRKEIGPA